MLLQKKKPNLDLRCFLQWRLLYAPPLTPVAEHPDSSNSLPLPSLHFSDTNS